MARKRKGRALDGVLLLNKPANISSNRALQRVKHLLFAAKAGHTGSLDPLATGLLPLCFGEATKFSQFLLDADKGYRVTVRLGETTSSGDADGDLLAQADTSQVTEQEVMAALAQFRGDIDQLPPMHSALKHQGQPLYKLARQGIEVERQLRQVSIYRLELLDFRPGPASELDLDVACSKGTYIRTLAQDLGERLGVGARVEALHRTRTGPFDVANATTLADLEAQLEATGAPESLDRHLLPMDAPVDRLPALMLPEESAFYFGRGNPVMDSQVYRLGDEGDMVRVFKERLDRPAEPRFMGLGCLTDEGQVAPRRLVAG